jgi:hypothetical protein
MVGDAVLQPGPADRGNNPGDLVARLFRFVPLSLSGSFNSGDNEVDCALAKMEPSVNLSREVHEIGVPAELKNPTVGQAVRKSGRTTGLTHGTVLSDNSTAIINYGTRKARFVNQIETTKICAGGDSGALLFDNASLAAVGLVFASNANTSYANKILRVIEELSRARVMRTESEGIVVSDQIDLGI